MKAFCRRWGAMLLLAWTLPAVMQAQLVFQPDSHRTHMTLIGYSGSGGAITVPGTFMGLPVTAITNSVFANQTAITSVTLPDSIITIGNDVFWGCTGLTSLVIPDSVTSIGMSLCFNCVSLTNAVIGSGVTNLGPGTFFGCGSLATFSMSNDLAAIPDRMFKGCGSLTGWNLPAHLVAIGDDAFDSCAGLTNAPIDTNTTSIGTAAFAACTGLTNIAIPPAITTIAPDAFEFCSGLTSLVIPTNVTVIGDSAFDHCVGLTNLIIGTNVTRIGDYAFSWCTGLTNLVIPNNVTHLGVDAFYNCSNVVSLTLSTNLTSLTNWVFTYLNLTNVIIPAGINSLGDYALGGWYHSQAIYFLGNAPTNLGLGVLQGDPATVYYLPGATGWGPYFAGHPTMMWNPQAACDGVFGVRTNRFGFNITGNHGLVVVVQACTNLASPVWMPVATNTLTGGTSYFGDAQWTNHPRRFYGFSVP